MSSLFRCHSLALLFVLSFDAADADGQPRIAVISAFPPEWQILKAAVENSQTKRLNGVDFVIGRLEDQDVVLFLSGESMVNAAMTTQLALDSFEIEGLVFSGIGGGVDPNLSVGDVVVAEKWAQYLNAAYARADGDGWSLPSFVTPAAPNYGMIHPIELRVARDGATTPEQKFWFYTDPKYLALAKSISGLKLSGCTKDGMCLKEIPEIIVGGAGVSGSAFVDNKDFREYTFDTYAAKVLDMESAAVAHVAHANEIPFIAFRSLSDLAGGGTGENEMEIFVGLASENSANVVREFLRVLQ